MKPTNEELRAAIEAALKAFIGAGPSYILRAHLETLDEERAFLEAAAKYFDLSCRDWDGEPTLGESLSVRGANGRIAYRALVAKREGK